MNILPFRLTLRRIFYILAAFFLLLTGTFHSLRYDYFQTFSSFVSGGATLFIAVCALIATIWQGQIARTHNILSATPHLRFVPEWSDDGHGTHEYTWNIFNAGPGLAIMESTQYKIDDEKWKYYNPSSAETILDSLIGPTYVHTLLARRTLNQDAVICAGDKHTLMRFSVRCDSNQAEILVNENFKRLRFKMVYKGMYQDRHEFIWPPENDA
ncbi:hypothetical protein IB233_03125 [Comamonas sp. CMM01]|uniref:hypothetical protein n=1 Tax=Comamonas sp. CMM01 TaxID=2769280 RepID=UPI00177EB110|nr:hypothetical protein [Comamonas sp. CMM01]MBD9530625.1 hypothetical protein [Comamonas sp. CMM01]